MAKRDDPLATYVAKRDFEQTPEPAGAKRSGRTRSLRFVIQKHRATRLHYDFRLEAGGVLASWAVPKGPSLDTKERRLAMHVEDHPYDYRTFEGIIPEGNYGAGEVIVWDEGTYRLAEGTDPVAEIANGKIKFILSGKKLHGMFTLVKIKKSDDDAWLLIKDKDQFVDPSWSVEDHAESVKTGRTLADLAHSPNVKKWISSRPAQAKKRSPARTEPLPEIAQPELATPVDRAFDDDGWFFELKWDGYRAIATIHDAEKVTVVSRNGNDLLAQFPELREIGQAFRSLPIVVDGEIVSLDAEGKPSFQDLQNRIDRFRQKARAGAGGGAITYVVFDCLYADGRDLRGEPLEERKRVLESLLVPGHRVMLSKHVVGKGTELYAFAESHGLEGIVGKRRDAPYRERRTSEWVKIKAVRRQEFVIGGWTDPRGSRKGFGALLLGVYEGETLRYAGHVGTGFDAKKIEAIVRKLEPLERKTSPFDVTPKTNAPAHFVRPVLVAEIKFTEWTNDGILRHPTFVALREDKDAKDVVRERAHDVAEVT